MSEYLGCGNHGCIIERPKEQGTNSSCKCVGNNMSTERINKTRRGISRKNRAMGIMYVALIGECESSIAEGICEETEYCCSICPINKAIKAYKEAI